MIYSPEMTALIFQTVASIEISNNGYCPIPDNNELIAALRTAGYVVQYQRDVFGRTVRYGYSRKAYDACNAYVAPVPAKKTNPYAQGDGIDYEQLILARDEKYLGY